MNRHLAGKTWLAKAILAISLVTSASSAMIGNGPPDQSFRSDMNSYVEADDFTVNSPFTVSSITYWSVQDNAASYAGSTDWAVYTDAAGLPGVAVFSGNAVAAGAATGNMTDGMAEFSYTMSVAFTLSAGDYWLVLHNGPASSIPTTNYYWAWSSTSGNSMSIDLTSPGNSWGGNTSSFAFQLSNGSAEPEPASLILVAGPILAAWLVSRSRA